MATKPFRSPQTPYPPRIASNNVNGKCDFFLSFLSCFPPLDRGKLGILHFLSKWTKRTKNHPKKSNFTFVILKDMLNTHCETSWIFMSFLYFLFRCRIRHFRPISAPIWGSPKMRGSQPISRPIGSGLEKKMRAPRSARVASNANMSFLQFSVHPKT